MPRYRVIKKKVNIRSKPQLTDDTYVGEVGIGATVHMNGLVRGDVIPETGNNLWLKDNNGRHIAYDAVIEEDLPDYITDFGIHELWKKTRGEGVTAVFIDSGYNKEADGSSVINEAESVSVIGGGISDAVGHGTRMVAVLKGNKSGICGVAPEAEVIVIKFTTHSDSIDVDSYLSALDHAKGIALQRHNYIVINCSLAFIKVGTSIADRTRITNKVNELLSLKNVVMCAAVGNKSKRGQPSSYPAGLQNLISCAGLMKSGSSYTRLISSNHWQGITIAAPGEYTGVQGSSEACAYSTGITCLLLSYIAKKGLTIDNTTIPDTIAKCTVQQEEEGLQYSILDKYSLSATFTNI